MDMHEISAIRKTLSTMWYIKKKKNKNKMVGSDFRHRFFWDKVFTEYDHETTLRYAEKLYHFGVMKLYASRVVLYMFCFCYIFPSYLFKIFRV